MPDVTHTYRTSSFPLGEGVPLLKQDDALPADVAPGSAVVHLSNGDRVILPSSLAHEWLHATDDALAAAGMQRPVKVELL